jgi:hypothetical protein
MRDQHRTIIVPAAQVSVYRDMADTFPGGTGMFVVPLYTGSDITHFISSGPIDPLLASMMPHTDYSGEESVTHEGDLEALVEHMNATEPESADLPTVTALLAACDISTQSAEEAIERLGLATQPTEVSE